MRFSALHAAGYIRLSPRPLQLLTVLCALLVNPASLAAQPRPVLATSAPFLPPWSAPGMPDVPAGAESVSVLLQDSPVYLFAGDTAHRRGLVSLGARLGVFALNDAGGCSRPWLLVGPSAWICGDKVAFESDIPRLDIAPPVLPNGLPYPYYFVGVESTYSYLNLANAGDEAPAGGLERGWAVPIVEERIKDKRRWGKTRKNRWIAMDELGLAHPTTFEGDWLNGAPLTTAWVLAERVNTFTTSQGTQRGVPLMRFQHVRVVAEVRNPQGSWCQVDAPLASPWVRCGDLVRHHAERPPREAMVEGPQTKWVDVELATQTLVAYEGPTPVFATLVSTGKGAQGTDAATPKGVHRIWVKIVTQTMDNVENEDAEHHYSIEDVPWVQFFHKGVALHGAFWHHNFGRVQSHGCVNLTPLDAKRLFDWTGPHLLSGYSAVYPSPYEPGSYVRIR
jgi:hypothetical protein